MLSLDTIAHDGKTESDPYGEQACVTWLMEHKGEALAGTAWECFTVGGRGALITNGARTMYLPCSFIRKEPAIPATTRRRLLRETRSYDPRREIVLVIPWADRAPTIARVVPPLDPEAAFLAHVGTAGFPPLRLIPVELPEGGVR